MVYAPPPAARGRRWAGGRSAGAAAAALLGLFGLLLVAGNHRGQQFGGVRTSWKQPALVAQSVEGAPLPQADARYQFRAPAQSLGSAIAAVLPMTDAAPLAYSPVSAQSQHSLHSPKEREQMVSSPAHEGSGALPAAGAGNHSPGFMIRLCWDAFDDGTDVAPAGWSSCANASTRCTTDEVVAAGCRSTCAVATGQPCITEAKSGTRLGEQRATTPIQYGDPILEAAGPAPYAAAAKTFSSSTVDSAMGMETFTGGMAPQVLSGEDKQASVYASMPLQPALSVVEKKKSTTTTLEQQSVDPYNRLD
eukprot:SAG31_NODE_2426_length_5721_cov_11.664176_4_plen_306_part_00